jgi:hypothetical protein
MKRRLVIMLNGIKQMIQQKKAFNEAASLILEDTAIGGKLDDSIILGEEAEEVPAMDPEIEEAKDDAKEEPEEKPSEEEMPTPEPGDDTPIEDQKIDDSEDNKSDDILDSDIEEPSSEPAPAEEPMPIPGDDSLPEPVGKQTGEPIDDMNDILSAEIDLGSNTMKDVLPIPPANAPEAVAGDDILNQRIDSGFGDEDTPNTGDVPSEPAENDILDAPIEGEIKPENPEEPSKESNDEDLKLEGKYAEDLFGNLNPDSPLFEGLDEESKKKMIENIKKYNQGKKVDGDGLLQEGITIGGADATTDDSASAPAEGGTDPAPADDGSVDVSSEPAPTEENPVTAAVKDKVAEADADSSTDVSPEASKDELLKKLGNITKSLEDAKRAVMNSIQ